MYTPKLVKNVDVVKSKYIRNEEYPWPGKEAGGNVKKNCKVRGKYNLEVTEEITVNQRIQTNL